MLKTGFIGAGKVGAALAVLLSRKGYAVTGVYDINGMAAEKLAAQIKSCRVMRSGQQVADNADIIFITTPDNIIKEAADKVAWKKGQSAVHCSGADSTDILEKARKAGAMVGGFHPLQTFAGTQQALENIPGSTFGIEAEEPLTATLETIAADLGGTHIHLKAGDKPAYHAAAVFASNYMVTLVSMAAELWKTFSIPTEQATQALLPLLEGTLHNIETIGLPQCLTGPIARGDTGTIRKHIDEIRKKTPELLFPYKELGIQTIPIAMAKGQISKEQAMEMELLLKNN
jgi:predicted short-subunit dehydrogenase-like oxidoreductase (DUF2520 family)